MGMLVEGKWVKDDLINSDSEGRFKRPKTVFHGAVGDPEFPAESGRYHLYISHACPWAHRTAIFRKIKKLEDHISLTVVDPLMLDNGWTLSQGADPIHNAKFLRDIYVAADSNYTGRVTVPVLWDKQNQTIVCNESSELIRQFNFAFNKITGNHDDYYPKNLQGKIDEMNAFVYPRINNGVYKCGFAKSQLAYDEAVESLFGALDELEDHLDAHEYLVGDQITEADWRLFTTLIRFDPVYVTHFKCNKKRIADYTNITRLMRVLYTVQGVADTIYMDHIREHYYASHLNLNPRGIIPAGFTVKL